MQNFLNGRQKVPGEKPSSGMVNLEGEMTSAQADGCVKDGAQVELVTEKGVVQKIIVTCKCGERIELTCKY
jgi:membrane-bound ClpP family serine protease